MIQFDLKGYEASPRKVKVPLKKLKEYLKIYPRELCKKEYNYEGVTYTVYSDEQLNSTFPYDMVAEVSRVNGSKKRDDTKCYILANYKECFDTVVYE